MHFAGCNSLNITHYSDHQCTQVYNASASLTGLTNGGEKGVCHQDPYYGTTSGFRFLCAVNEIPITRDSFIQKTYLGSSSACNSSAHPIEVGIYSLDGCFSNTLVNFGSAATTSNMFMCGRSG